MELSSIYYTGMAQNTLSSIYIAILISCFVSITIYCCYHWITLHNHRQNLSAQFGCEPPRPYPQKDPIFGLDMLWDTVAAVKSKSYLDRARRLYEQHGNTYSSYSLGSSFIYTIEPENIKAILLTNFKDFGITSRRKRAFLPVVGERSILVSDGPQWDTARTFLRPVFAKSQVQDFTILERHVSNLIKTIPKDGSMVNLAGLFFELTSDVAVDLIFGKSANSPPESSPAYFAEAFHDLQASCQERWRRGKLANILPHAHFYRSLRKVHDFVNAHVQGAIEYHKARAAGTTSATATEKTERYILLHELGKLTNDATLLRDELTTIFLAGRDSTASLLCNVFFILARRPDAWKLIQGEIDILKGQRPTFEQLNQMDYIKFSIYEGRLFSS